MKGVYFDILKYIALNQLCWLKQVNRYFRNQSLTELQTANSYRNKMRIAPNSQPRLLKDVT